MPNNRQAGRICGNPTDGLTERFCIEALQVFDGCAAKYEDVTHVVTLQDIPATAVPPFTFTGAASAGEARIENLSVIPLGNGCCCRIACDVIIPICVHFRDAEGKCCSARACLKVYRDMRLKVPMRSLTPYQIKVQASLLSTIGTFMTENMVSFQACYIIIIKVVVPVEILVPSYGYCVYPDCDGASSQRCNALFDLPLFPQTEN